MPSHSFSALVLFDIDGTLLRTGDAGQAAMERALRDAFELTAPFEGVATAGRTDRGIVREIFERYAIEDTATNREAFRRSYLGHLPDCLKVDNGLLLPGVRELLNALPKKSSLLRGLLTGNYEHSAWMKLRHFGLDDYFTFGGFGDHSPQRNDVAATALDAARQHVSPNHTFETVWVVGDTPADIRCARSINARVACVTTGVYSADELAPHDPDLLLDRIDDPRLLAALTREIQ